MEGVTAPQAGPPRSLQRPVAAHARADEHVYVRTTDEITAWFDGVELVEPGVTFLPDWRPESADDAGDVARPWGYGAVARG
jgi:hypothetical protein